MPKEDEVVRGPKRRLARRLACATLVVLEAYLEGKRRPLTYDQCVRLVKPFGTQPNLVLHEIEQAGFFIGDASKAKNRARIVNPNLGLEAMVDGVLVRFWPDPEPAARRAIQDLTSHAGGKVRHRTPKPPQIAQQPRSVPTADEVLALIREHFVDREFTIPQLRNVAGLTLKAYDRVSTLVTEGRIVHVSGTGHKSSPRHFRMAGMEDVATPTTPVSSPMLKSREELEVEIASLIAEIERANGEVHAWESEGTRLDALVTDREREFEAARAKRDAHHRLPKPTIDLTPLLDRRSCLQSLVDNYDLLVKKE